MARYYDIAPHNLTSASGGGLTVTASSEYGSSYEVFRVFSLGTTVGYYWVTASGASLPQYVQVQLDSAQTIAKVALRSNSMTEPNRQIMDFQVRGSNNGSDWTSLLSVTGETSWGDAELREFTLTTTGSYTYYQIYITDNNGDSLTSLADLYLLCEGGVVSWDNASASHALTNEDRTITADGPGGSWVYSEAINGQVRAGQYQWSITVDTDLTASINIGINGAEGDNTGIPGVGQTGATFANDGSNAVSGWTDAMSGSFTYTTADELTFVLDMDAGKLWIKKNGTLVQTGDIAAGTGAVVTGITTWCNPFVATLSTGAVVTGNFTESQMTESLETGFEALGTLPEISADIDGAMPAIYGESVMFEDLLAAVEGTMPALYGESVGIRHVHCATEGVMPPLYGEAYSGGFVEGRMPKLYGEASVTVANIALVDGRMPKLYGDSAASISVAVALEGTMPTMYGEAVCVRHISCTTDGVFPKLYGEVGSLNSQYSIEGIFPALFGDSVVDSGSVSFGYLRYVRGVTR